LLFEPTRLVNDLLSVERDDKLLCHFDAVGWRGVVEIFVLGSWLIHWRCDRTVTIFYAFYGYFYARI